MRGISWPAEERLASQEGLCSFKLGRHFEECTRTKGKPRYINDNGRISSLELKRLLQDKNQAVEMNGKVVIFSTDTAEC